MWKSGLISDKSLESDPGVTFTFNPLVAVDPVFASIIINPNLLGAAIQLLGRNIRLQHSQAMVKLPSPKDNRKWHVDGAWPNYYPSVAGRVPLLELNASIMLSENCAKPGGGSLNLVPGSHLLPPPTPDEFTRLGTSLEGAVEILQPPGSMTLFHNAIWHSGGNNRTLVPRINIFITFCHAWMQPVDFVPSDIPFLHTLNALNRRLIEGPHGSNQSRFYYDDGLPISG